MTGRLGAHDTPTLSDALDRLGIAGQCLGIMPLSRDFRLVGQAFTVRMLPVGTTGGSVGDYVDDVGAGQVVVIDNGGRRDVTVWGDILTSVGHRNGLAGTVIDGVCRDAGRSLEVGYPIFALGNTMRTGKDRVTAVAYNEPIGLAGVSVEAGDWLVGDVDGVLVVPRDRADDVLAAATEIAAAEERIRTVVDAGSRLDAARKREGYHALQSRKRS